jgi:hypothetical protein
VRELEEKGKNDNLMKEKLKQIGENFQGTLESNGMKANTYYKGDKLMMWVYLFFSCFYLFRFSSFIVKNEKRYLTLAKC